MQSEAAKLDILCEQTIDIFDESKLRILQIIYAKHVKDQKKNTDPNKVDKKRKSKKELS